MKTEKRIVFACFTGAALGTVVALQLHLFWWVGILLGALTGYLSFGFKEVLSAMVTAWKTLRGDRFSGHALKTDFLNALRFIAVFVCVTFGAASVIVLSIGAVMLLTASPKSSTNWTATPVATESMPMPQWLWVLAGAGVGILALVLGVAIFRAGDKKQVCRWILGCIAATPLVLPITLLVFFGSTIASCGGRLVVRLARETFILIHSEVRLLCLTDALLGSLVGYLCGNALVGGMIGAVLGWANYRFVSVRWLRLAKS